MVPVEPFEVTGAIAETMEVFTERASDFCYRLVTVFTGSGNMGGLFCGVDSGAFKCFPDSHAGNIKALGKFYHWYEFNDKSMNNFSAIIGS